MSKGGSRGRPLAAVLGTFQACHIQEDALVIRGDKVVPAAIVHDLISPLLSRKSVATYLHTALVHQSRVQRVRKVVLPYVNGVC